jgi:hypothetical protein
MRKLFVKGKLGNAGLSKPTLPHIALATGLFGLASAAPMTACQLEPFGMRRLSTSKPLRLRIDEEDDR